MMNSNCRNNFRTQPCQFGVFRPSNFFAPITASVGNWIQNTANMFLDPNRYVHNNNNNNRLFSTNSSYFNRPAQGAYVNIKPYINIVNIDNTHGDTMDFNINNAKPYNKTSPAVFNTQMDGTGHRLGHNNFDRNHFRSGCDETENSHFNYNRGNGKSFHKMSYPKDNKNKRNGYNRHGYLPKSSEKHKSSIAENSQCYTNDNRSGNYNNNCNNLKLRNTSCSISNNINNRPTEVVAIFTLEDFPELPVPKQRHEPWSFKFPGSCSSKSKNQIASKMMKENTNNKSPEKCKSSKMNKCSNVYSKAQNNNFNSKESDKHDLIEENFVIIMDTKSPKFSNSDKLNSNSTAGFTPFRPRQRQMSECSDDSFIICFTNDAADGVIEFTDFSSSDDDDDDDTDDSDSDDDLGSSDFKQNENKCQYNKIHNNNNKDNKSKNFPKKKTENIKSKHSKLETLSVDETASQPDSGFDDIKDKKVRFNLKPEVHVMHTWDYAYRAARKGDWESYARDRCRFKKRIENVNPIISAVLSTRHREQIFNERFSN